MSASYLSIVVSKFAGSNEGEAWPELGEAVRKQVVRPVAFYNIAD